MSWRLNSVSETECLPLPTTTGTLTFSLKGHQSFHVFTTSFNVSRKVSKRMKRREVCERKTEGERQHEQEWSRTLRDTRSKREKDQRDQLSNQGQSYEVHILSSYLIQIHCFEWLRGEWCPPCPFSLTCLECSSVLAKQSVFKSCIYFVHINYCGPVLFTTSVLFTSRLFLIL